MRASAGIGDEGHVSNVAQHLMAALGVAKDPNLRESLSNALAAIHKHMANFQKERHQALQGKFSPRLLEEAYGAGHASPGSAAAQMAAGLPNPGGHIPGVFGGPAVPAHLLAAQGNYAQAAAQWTARHPYAVEHGHIPAFVSQWIQQAQQADAAAHTNAPAGTATAY